MNDGGRGRLPGAERTSHSNEKSKNHGSHEDPVSQGAEKRDHLQASGFRLQAPAFGNRLGRFAEAGRQQPEAHISFS